MKKKILVVSLAVALMAIAVGGTLAWFMDADEVKNVFTIGSVEIEQIEQFTQESQLLPVVTAATDGTVVPTDHNFVEKIVTVKNTGKNAAYVQTFVAVPQALDSAGVLHVYNNVVTTYGWTKAAQVAGTVTENVLDPTNGDANKVYNVYKYVYNAELVAGATTDAVISGVYIDKNADLDVERDAQGNVTAAHFVMGTNTITGFDASGKLNVYVATQAIQADGFASKEAALASFVAHPWAQYRNL